MKKLFLLIIGLVMIVPLSGCDVLKKDTMEDINIVTTAYPIEYITNRLYGQHSLITSIYPDDVNISTYKLNDKQLREFSKKELFIYTGVGADKDIARNLLNMNKKLLIIDSSYGMSPNYIEEVWLNPANMLMISQNIKNGLLEYINNSYLRKDILDEYDRIKIELSELDADFKLTCENAVNKTIVTSNNALKYLEKYGLTVISLEDNNSDKKISDVTDLITAGSVRYIYTLENTTDNDAVKLLMSNTDVKQLIVRKIDNITEKERNSNDDYIKLMKDNLELLKKEMYN
jgi:ABC-type metal ion transport system, periplasmic component/surface adhesin